MPEIFIAIVSILLVAVSQLLFKSAMSTPRDGTPRSIRRFAHPKIILGLALNLASALCWILALTKLPVSYLYPLLSINYLLVPLGAWLLFEEKLRRRRCVAICVICAGVFVCLLGGQGT